MSVRRLAASVLLATAALGLTACSSGSGGTAAAGQTSATATAAGTAASAGAADGQGGSSTAKPSAKPSATAAKQSGTAKPTPAGDCTANAQRPGHKVINGVTAWGDPDRIGANETRFVCGPDVPGEGYWESTVSSKDAYLFAPGATAQLLAGIQAQDVPIPRLLQQINACTQNPGANGQFGCYGNMYDVTLDASGKITKITALYHP